MKKTLFLVACATILSASFATAQTTKAPVKHPMVQKQKQDLKKDQKGIKQDKSTLQTDKNTAGTGKKKIAKDQIALHRDRHDRNKDVKNDAKKIATRKEKKGKGKVVEPAKAAPSK